MSAISSISSSVNPIQSNVNNGFGQSLTALQSALQSGNLSTAQSAFSTLLNALPTNSQSSSTTTSSSTSSSNNLLSNNLQALQSAIQSGNVNAAQSALAKVTSDLVGSRGNGHHHRHGGGLLDTLSSNSSQSSSSTSSSSATTSATTDRLNAITSPTSGGSLVNYLA